VIPIDFSATACRWQPSGRNDIEHHKTLSTARNMQYSLRDTNKERRVKGIFFRICSTFRTNVRIILNEFVYRISLFE